MSGAALYVESGCIVTISNTSISDNSVTNSGGAVFLHNSSLLAIHCTFCNNTAPLGGFGFGYMSTINVSECQISDNRACCQKNEKLNLHKMGQNMDKSDNECEEIGGYGGAVHAEMNTVVLKMTLFLNKEHASKAGGVIQVYSGPAC